MINREDVAKIFDNEDDWDEYLINTWVGIADTDAGNCPAIRLKGDGTVTPCAYRNEFGVIRVKYNDKNNSTTDLKAAKNEALKIAKSHF